MHATHRQKMLILKRMGERESERGGWLQKLKSIFMKKTQSEFLSFTAPCSVHLLSLFLFLLLTPAAPWARVDDMSLKAPKTYPSGGRLSRGAVWGPPGHVGVQCNAEHGGNDEVPQGVCMSLKTPTTPPLPTDTDRSCLCGRPPSAKSSSHSQYFSPRG